MILVEQQHERRAAAVAAYGAVRRPPRELDEVVALAARIAGVPMAAVNIITATEQHQISTFGFEGSVCPRESSLCNTVLDEDRAIVVDDASRDPRFADNPFVTGALGDVRFYAGIPLVNGSGVTVGTLCVFDEMSHNVDLEALAGLAALAARVIDVFELRMRGSELAMSLMEVQAVQADLERSNERLASFAGQVSHDLKTPLTALSLSLALVRDQVDDGGALGPESVGPLDRAIEGSHRMADLIDGVLDYARLGTLTSREVDLDSVLGEVLNDLDPELEDVEVRIGRMPTVLGDRAQLRSVLQNLMSNASKYRHPARPPVITLSARHVQRAWRIEVTDNGRGIDTADRARVFESLARVDDAVEGNGIGLATCRRIIGAHGGSIGIDAAYRDGCRFWFELPD